MTNCADGGVLGVVPGILGTLQALEAIKVATNCGESLSGRMMVFDAEDSLFRVQKILICIVEETHDIS